MKVDPAVLPLPEPPPPAASPRPLVQENPAAPKSPTPSSPQRPAAAVAEAPRQRPEILLPRAPVLHFSPTAWAKLQFFCHAGDTEVGGFGVTEPEDLLLVVDFVTVVQRVSSVTVAFDDVAVADFFDAQVDVGRKPEQFGRIWVHTHPGNSPTPSYTDEATFQRVFGTCDWAVMAIVARGGQTYARLRFNVGPGGQIVIPIKVDYDAAFTGSDHEAWVEEYLAHIHPEPIFETLLDSKLDRRIGKVPTSDIGMLAEQWGFQEELEARAEAELLAYGEE